MNFGIINSITKLHLVGISTEYVMMLERVGRFTNVFLQYKFHTF